MKQDNSLAGNLDDILSVLLTADSIINYSFATDDKLLGGGLGAFSSDSKELFTDRLSRLETKLLKLSFIFPPSFLRTIRSKRLTTYSLFNTQDYSEPDPDINFERERLQALVRKVRQYITEFAVNEIGAGCYFAAFLSYLKKWKESDDYIVPPTFEIDKRLNETFEDDSPVF